MRAPTLVRAIGTLGLVGAGALVARPAGAVEQQQHLGLAPELAVLSIKDKSTASVGAGGAIHYAYGLTDQWNLTAEVSSAIVAAKQRQDFPEAPRNRPAGVDQASIGASYVIDILRWVPYIGAELGAYRLSGGTLPSALFLPGVAAAAGLDYQITRQWAVGVGVREHFMVTKLSTYPSYTTVLFRFEYMWGY